MFSTLLSPLPSSVRLNRTLMFTALLGASATALAAPAKTITLEPLGTYAAGAFDAGAAEIVAHDPQTQRLFVINASAAVVDVLDISNPAAPAKVSAIDVGAVLTSAGGINSVAVHGNLVAVAVENTDKQASGWIAFYDTNGTYLNHVQAGALPDMVTFTPNGRYVLSANEGEPGSDYANDPEGTVTIVNLSRGVMAPAVMTASFPDIVSADVRISGIPGTTVQQDLEPEYITTSADSKTAWVTLQENNAIAVINIATATVLDVVGLGVKDHALEGYGLDASNQDDAINIRSWSVGGLYMPDAIASFRSRGKTYLITANEGDAREYEDYGDDGYADIARIKDVDLDPAVFPDAATLQSNENLGRLNIVSTEGDTDNDGDLDALYSFGGRSISIWNAAGVQVFDSGDTMEQMTAALLPDYFNATNDDNDSFDNRSDDKGPEPEGVAVGKIKGSTYAFVGLERVGGIMIFDVTEPEQTTYVSYYNNRNFAVDATIEMEVDGEMVDVPNPAAGDLGPEGLTFIKAEDSPNGKPMLVVGNEISGTTTLYQVVKK